MRHMENKNPSYERFTWRKKNLPVVKSRLDFWLLSKKLEHYVQEADIMPSINTDHSAISLGINNFPQEIKGNGIWRLYTSFLS